VEGENYHDKPGKRSFVGNQREKVNSEPRGRGALSSFTLKGRNPTSTPIRKGEQQRPQKKPHDFWEIRPARREKKVFTINF